MKYILQLLLFFYIIQHAEQANCKYEERSFTSICTEATSAFFKNTNYRFRHPEEIVQCTNCTLTIIESNNFGAYENEIKVLNLTKSQINIIKPKAFVGLPFLEKLILTLNKIGTISPMTFWGINKILYLDLRNNQITVLLADGFIQLINLKTLLLQNNYIKVIEKTAFSGLTALETLDLSNNEIIDISEVFARLPSLVLLNLQQNLIQVILPVFFNNRGSLLQLNLADNRIKSIPDGTFSPNLRLETLNLSSNPIESLAPGCFRGLHALEDLDLSNASITDVAKYVLSTLYSLRSLDLSNNQIQGFQTGRYSSLPELRILNVSHNVIERFSKSGTFSLARLKILDLSYNLLQDLDYKSLVDYMPSLSYLEASNNSWRCDLAREIEEEFEHDNININMGQQLYETNITCDGSKWSNASSKEIPETASFIGKSDRHQYILYSFIVVFLIIMSYMFYVELQNRKRLRNIIGGAITADVQFLYPK